MENTYRTAFEIAFIRKLGTFAETTRKVPVEKLLQGYISAAAKRHDWDSMDSQKVLKAARDRLEKVRAE